MSTQPGPGLVSNTGNPLTGDPKPALDTVRRWNDGGNRHTLYTVCGTQQDGWGFYNDPGTESGRSALLGLVNMVLAAGGLSPINALPADGTSGAALGMASPDTVIGTRVNKNLWDWVPVSYPASFPGAPANLDNGWQPSNISFVDSVNTGTNQLISLIQQTPGTFALCGMSQGSMVISNVLKAMQPGGKIASRAQDCIAGVAFGNPMRKAGSGMPGVAPGTGAGMFSLPSSNGAISGLANVTLPSWWWELSTPGDFFSDAPMAAASGTAGTILSRIASALVVLKNTNTANPLDFPLQLVNALASGVGAIFNAARTQTGVAGLRTLGLWLRDLGFLAGLNGRPILLGIIQGLFKLTPQELTSQLLAGNFPNGNPHLFYGVWKPTSLPTGLSGVDNTSTYVDIGVAYLNQVGAAVTPRGSRSRTP